MSALASERKNGSRSDSRGVVKRRIVWDEVTPFPGNPIYDGRLASMTREWGGYNHAIVGSPAIFLNDANAFPDYPTDTLFIGDGNHRRALALDHDAGNKEFLADLYRGLTRVEMFRIRRGLNDRRTVKPAERFIALVEEGDRDRQRILEIVWDEGWNIGYEPAEGFLTCTNELEWIWKQNPVILSLALGTYTGAFGMEVSKVQNRVLKGIGAFYLRWPDADPARVMSVLSRIKPVKASVSKSEQLYAEGRRLADEFSNYAVADGIRHRIASYYNENLKPGRGTPRLSLI